MKTNIRIFTVLLIIMTSCAIYPGKTSAQISNVSFQVFYDELSPYGQWIDYSNYGYVWIPDAGADFVPYSTNGHWILTDDGWAWDSDYNWGWAAFHYGRWSFSESFGWFWVPDNEWGPAWVNWREADGYYGWSPMEPGMSVNMSFGTTYDSHNDHWIFVNNRDIERTDINLYFVNQADHERIARNSTVIHNTYLDNSRHITYVSGPSRMQVQKVTGRTITPVIVRENNKPGKEISNGELKIYRPQVVKNDNTGRKSAPSHIATVNELKHTPARNSSNQNQIGNPVNRNMTQPVKVVSPQPNYSQPGQDRNANRQDNKQVQQNNITLPTNTNHNIQSVQNPLTNPSDMNRPIRKPDAVTPQNNTQQPMPQRTITPQNNNPQPSPQRTVSPQNNNPQPTIQRPVVPQNNNQPQPQRNVNQQNNQGQKPNPPANVENKPQQVQPQQVNQNNKKPVRQKKSIKQNVKIEQAKVPDAVPDKK